ncbi:hypothetical protein CUJ84_Chr002266 [Rhizobium leguminosarum]|uniref:Uncharacterized protein n=1 Tax=Rhizobium leguminosarum TaxID=384 RepID=A0A2K9Z313_RHILE|nr:hypothetical protein CUJ84_Chr002266 [Rhizobium leguminosarum]
MHERIGDTFVASGEHHRSILLKLIAQKKKTLKPAKKTARDQKEDAGPTSNVINIMDALRKSMEADLKSRKSG